MTNQQYTEQSVIDALESAKNHRLREVMAIDGLIAQIKNNDLISASMDETEAFTLQITELTEQKEYYPVFKTKPIHINIDADAISGIKENYTFLEEHIKEFHLNRVAIKCTTKEKALRMFDNLTLFLKFHRFCTIKLTEDSEQYFITLKQGYDN